MRRRLPALLLIGAIFALFGFRPLPPGDPYGPLTLYQGTWREMPAGKMAYVLKNDCARVGLYYVCQQTVRGKVSTLMIFVPRARRGHYYVQGVLPQGYATGRTNLTIQGSVWIYSSKGQDDSGKTVYFRTTNTFSGNNHIHYQTVTSSDGQHWRAVGSGEEQRRS